MIKSVLCLNAVSGEYVTRLPVQATVNAPIGADALLPCVGNHNYSDLAWRHVGTSRRPNKILSNGSLLVENVSDTDTGNYTCMVEGKDDSESEDLTVVKLIVICELTSVSISCRAVVHSFSFFRFTQRRRCRSTT